MTEKKSAAGVKMDVNAVLITMGGLQKKQEAAQKNRTPVTVVKNAGMKADVNKLSR